MSARTPRCRRRIIDEIDDTRAILMVRVAPCLLTSGNQLGTSRWAGRASKPLPEETSMMARRCVNQGTTRSRALGMPGETSSEDVWVSEVILPEQFQNLWR